MTDWNKIKSDAQETLKSIDTEKLNKTSYTLLGASLAILNHKEPTDGAETQSPYVEKALDELNGAEGYISDYVKTKDLEYLQLASDERRHYAKFENLLIQEGHDVSAMQKRIKEVDNKIEFYSKGKLPFAPNCNISKTNIAADTVNINSLETDYVPSSFIDERKQESLRYFIKYMGEKSLEQTTGAALHGEYAERALKQMLLVDGDIAIMLYNSADEAERRLIAESYRKILSKVQK